MSNDILYITVKSAKDNIGRQHFILEWMDTNIGYFRNEVGLRGQVSFAVLSQAVEQFERKGFSIVYKTLQL